MGYAFVKVLVKICNKIEENWLKDFDYEVLPTFFDRFSLEKMIDKIVTQYPIYKLLSHRKAKLYNRTDFLLINDRASKHTSTHDIHNFPP